MKKFLVILFLSFNVLLNAQTFNCNRRWGIEGTEEYCRAEIEKVSDSDIVYERNTFHISEKEKTITWIDESEEVLTLPIINSWRNDTESVYHLINNDKYDMVFIIYHNDQACVIAKKYKYQNKYSMYGFAF